MVLFIAECLLQYAHIIILKISDFQYIWA